MRGFTPALAWVAEKFGVPVPPAIPAIWNNRAARRAAVARLKRRCDIGKKRR